MMGISVESTEWFLLHCFQVELEFGNGFLWREEKRSTRRKTLVAGTETNKREEKRSTRRKTLVAGTETNNKLNPHMIRRPGIKPGPHWWEASALTTAPSLLPVVSSCVPRSFMCKLTHSDLFGYSQGFRLRPEAGRFVRSFPIPSPVLWCQYLRFFFNFFIIIIFFT